LNSRFNGHHPSLLRSSYQNQECMKTKFIPLFLMFSTYWALAQQSIPFSADQWQLSTKDYAIENYLGKECILLKDNRAYLKDVKFRNGIIEYDVAMPHGRAFVGVTFRMADEYNGEEFYLRPHQSGNPDANQYCPVYNGVAGWQLYFGEGFCVPIAYSFDEWFHVKLIINEDQMEVYIADMEKPALFVPKLKRTTQAGFVGLYSATGSAHFANFSFTSLDHPQIKSQVNPEVSTPEGTITSYEVSDPFAEKSLDGVDNLTDKEKNLRSWKKALTENSGLLNLAGTVEWSENTNATFVKIVIQSEKNQIKKLNIGFSDRVKVYLNNQILFSAHDEFQTRDYRFLGSIGYYDEVWLSLKKGTNEVLISVSENFGGWGIQTKIEDQKEITIKKYKI
jgi:hypothetical protein